MRTGLSRNWRRPFWLIVCVTVGALACRNGTRAGGAARVGLRRGDRSPRLAGSRRARSSSSRWTRAIGVEVGALIARLSTTDAELNIRRAEAERDQAIAQLRLLEAGARPEEIRQAQAQLDSAEADVRAAAAELQSAEADLQRFDALLAANAGSRKQRDDALTRRDVAIARVAAAATARGRQPRRWRRVRSGARKEEIAAARARVGGRRRPDRVAPQERVRRRADLAVSRAW